MLCRELLLDDKAIDAEIYTRQLRDLTTTIRVKRPRPGAVHLLHHNALPDLVSATRRRLEVSVWKAVSHPPYCPTLAP
ncbi:hypothetical protein RB195_023286 [Necator americanus]|uniref:Uncharacterized protein n=1 Tax=Necator americanus TaxID=51031 RepID=A0ABR1EII8_NECAM